MTVPAKISIWSLSSNIKISSETIHLSVVYINTVTKKGREGSVMFLMD